MESVTALLVSIAAVLRQVDKDPTLLFSTSQLETRVLQELIEQWRDNPALSKADYHVALMLHEAFRRSLNDEKMILFDPKPLKH